MRALLNNILSVIVLFTLAYSSAQPVFGQASKASPLIRDGNKLYQEKKFNEAEVAYRKSLSLDKENKAGGYNLGNSLYKQGNYEGASRQYNELIQRKDLSKEQKARSLHNLGNSLLQEKKYDESIEAFKQSLKLSPQDNDTRYNLAYAQSMLRQQQQQQQQQNKSGQDKQQQEQQQQQQQEKEKQKKDQQQQDQQSSAEKDQEKKNGEQQKASGKKGISKEDAEKILQALNNDEKKLQEKLNKKEAVRVRIEKNW
jgi:tetratricopeptide (TPR) repeat protein